MELSGSHARGRALDHRAARSLLAAQQGIAFETVFSTPDKIDFVARAKHAGYFVRVFFIGTSDPRINAARVAGRVMAGGHTVSIEKIVSRYGRSMANLDGVIDIADRVYIYDNSVEHVEARLCVRTSDGHLRKIYGPLPAWIADPIRRLPTTRSSKISARRIAAWRTTHRNHRRPRPLTPRARVG